MKKTILPVESKLTLWGDIHGSVHSLCRTISNFLDSSWKIVDPCRYLVFLGDYVDRGPYSIEVLFIIFKLKIRNPQNVIILRGDHEMPSMILSKDSFIKELKKKFSNEWLFLYELLTKTFNYFACAEFVTFVKNGDTISLSPNYMLVMKDKIFLKFFFFDFIIKKF